MKQKQITEWNVGENLDRLMNLDPRGYGVCRILYEEARNVAKQPLTMQCGSGLHEILEAGDVVYIITGFVLLPNKHAEMDGIVGSMLLARALVKAYQVKPLLICPKEAMQAVKNLAPVVGLHFYSDMEEFKEYPISVGAYAFTKEKEKAAEEADYLMEELFPKAVIAIEAPGSNEKGIYHNAVGKNLTALEAKSDILFEKCQKAGVWNMAIGDLGNEIGMGALKKQLQRYVPYMEENGCICGCGGGSMAKTAADHVLTATISDWGCYGMIAAIAYINHNIEIMHTGEMEREAIQTASNSGMVDMYGWLEYAIDGIAMDFHIHLVELMRLCVENAFKHEEKCGLWFEKVERKQYFSQQNR